MREVFEPLRREKRGRGRIYDTNEGIRVRGKIIVI
jgi:hypothetical protein